MNNNITCPKCGNEFDVENVLASEIEKKLKTEYQEQLKDSLDSITAEREKLAKELEVFEEKKKNENKIFQERLLQEKNKIQAELNEQIKVSLGKEYEGQLALLQKNNQENEQKLKEARAKELEFIKKENELINKEAELEISIQRRIQEERAALAETIRSQELEKNALKENELMMKMKELEKQLDDQKNLADQMKRKAEQGSMQLQGEVQELALEALLRSHFPFDVVSEVGKGVKGADCILTIQNQFGHECGKIIFESKRTENFAADWIDKLKADMLSQKADLAVIVTKAMPKDLDQFGEKNGVYICSFKEVKSLTQLLRMGIIKVYEARKNQENKGDKMVALYNYLTGSEFIGNWNAIREGFGSLRQMLQKERDDFERNWKKKEKQLELIIQNSLQISGSMQGIAGQNQIDMELLEKSNEPDELPE
jgi:hypothetical protein